MDSNSSAFAMVILKVIILSAASCLGVGLVFLLGWGITALVRNGAAKIKSKKSSVPAQKTVPQQNAVA